MALRQNLLFRSTWGRATRQGLAAALLVAAGCTGEGSSGRASRSLGVLSQVPVASFLPSASNQIEAVAFSALVYERLTSIDSTGALQPALAQAWTSSDQRHWRFMLRRNVRFHDGSPFGAADVVRSWKQALAEPPGSPAHVWVLDDVVGAEDFTRGRSTSIEGLRVLDDSTIEVALRRPDGEFPMVAANPALAILGAGASAQHVNGTGPWRLAQGRPMDSLYVLSRNTSHWDVPPRLDSLRVVVVSDGTALARALSRGAIDCVPGADDFGTLALRTDFSLHVSPPTWWVVVSLNHRHPLIRQAAFREALSLALDRALLARVVQLPTVNARASALAPGFVAWDTGGAPVAQDLPRARALLATIPGSREGTLRVAWPSPDTTLPLLQTFRDALAGVGIRTRVQRTTSNASADFLRDSVDLHIWRWLAPPGGSTLLLRQLFHSRSTSGLGNAFGIADPAVDSALDRVQGLPAGPQRDTAAVALGEFLFERQPSLFLFFYPMTTASSRRVTRCPAIATLPTYTTVDLASGSP